MSCDFNHILRTKIVQDRYPFSLWRTKHSRICHSADVENMHCPGLGWVLWGGQMAEECILPLPWPGCSNRQLVILLIVASIPTFPRHIPLNNRERPQTMTQPFACLISCSGSLLSLGSNSNPLSWVPRPSVCSSCSCKLITCFPCPGTLSFSSTGSLVGIKTQSWLSCLQAFAYLVFSFCKEHSAPFSSPPFASSYPFFQIPFPDCLPSHPP